MSKVATIGDTAFANCTSLEKVELEAITSIENLGFYNCPKLLTFICKAVEPPTIASNTFGATSSSMKIYVPDESVDAYKAKENWSALASRIKPLSEYVEQ